MCLSSRLGLEIPSCACTIRVLLRTCDDDVLQSPVLLAAGGGRWQRAMRADEYLSDIGFRCLSYAYVMESSAKEEILASVMWRIHMKSKKTRY